MDADGVLCEVLLDAIVLDEEGAAGEVAVESLDDQGSVADFEVVSAKVFINISASW